MSSWILSTVELQMLKTTSVRPYYGKPPIACRVSLA